MTASEIAALADVIGPLVRECVAEQLAVADAKAVADIDALRQRVAQLERQIAEAVAVTR